MLFSLVLPKDPPSLPSMGWVRFFFFFCMLFALARGGTTGLADFGGDVGQYMTLLEGSSAFSFGPASADGGGGGKEDLTGEEDVLVGEEEEEEARRRSVSGAESSETAMGDFGGDYGDYLRLLEGDTALGFNPQSDPVSDNQDLQTDVFGGAVSGKYWDMYKGKTSYDDDADGNLDEDDDEVPVVSEMQETEDGLDVRRQTPEQYQPMEAQVKEERRREAGTAAKQMLLKWAAGKRRQKDRLKEEKDKRGQKEGAALINYQVKKLASKKPRIPLKLSW